MLIEDEDSHGNKDDYIDQHLLQLDGLDLDGEGYRWAYPWNRTLMLPRWIEKVDDGREYRRTSSR